MATILSLVVERLDAKIARLRKAQRKLKEKNLEDKKLDYQIRRLVSIRGRLKKTCPTGGSAIDPGHTPTNGETIV